MNAGDSVYLSVIAEGYPAPQIQWEKDGVLIPGATGASYYIASASQASEGGYKALVSNPEGSVYSFEAQIELPPGAEYINWISSYGLVAEDGAEGADPDFDGIANLVEFAFKLDPTVSGNG